MRSDATAPSSRTSAQRWVAIGLFLTIVAAGIVWGPAGVRALKYRYYEKFELPEGGVVSFFAFRGEGKGANALYAPSPENFVGSAGEPPIALTVGSSQGEMVFLFPGAQADFEEDGFIFVRKGPRESQDARWQRLVDRREEAYPGLDWSSVRGWIVGQPWQSFGEQLPVALPGGGEAPRSSEGEFDEQE